MNKKLQEELQKPIVKYGIAIVLLLVVIQRGLLPWLEWREGLQEELSVKASLVIDEETILAGVENITQRQSSLAMDLASLKKRFEGDITNAKVALPTEVRQICSQFDIKVNRVAVNQVESDSPTLQSFVVSLEAQGSVDRLFQMISELENTDAFFVVDRLTVYSRRKEQMKVRMELRKYVAVN